MAETIKQPPKSLSIPEQYRDLLLQTVALCNGEPDAIARMANVCAVLKASFGFLWIGFYRVSGGELILGPFQGPVACTRIPFGKGVCGTAWREDRVVNVPDVDAFPGHIACSSLSKSELVIPVHDHQGAVSMVLDVDSEQPAFFTAEHQDGLCAFVDWIETW